MPTERTAASIVLAVQHITRNVFVFSFWGEGTQSGISKQSYYVLKAESEQKTRERLGPSTSG